MNSLLMFIFGGVVGVLVHKFVSEAIYRKKRQKAVNVIVDVAEKIIDKIEKSPDGEKSDDLLDLDEVLEDLREAEFPKED